MAEETTGERRRAARLELVATLLLAFATVATAWSAYQARVWTGEQAKLTSRATASRIEVNRSAALANRQVQIDVATFSSWVDARAQDDSRLADFYAERFRDEFKPAFDAWLATEPLDDPSAPKTPFTMPEYRLQADADAAQQEAQGAALAARSSRANTRANNYMLAVVLFATALFCAGMATKLHGPRLRMGILGLGCAVFVVTLVWVATFPAMLTF
jgi:hypothetical protein